jgi:molecular chaperone GrpE
MVEEKEEELTPQAGEVETETTPSDAGSEGEPEAAEPELPPLEAKLAEVEASLAEAQAKAAENLDGWQRAQAAFQNYRKRTEVEQAQFRSAANAQILSRLLPVLDDFKRAFESVPEAYEDDGWIGGIRLIQRKVKAILDSENVKPIALEPGDAFDPKYHEAILYQEVEGFEEGQVVAEVETGYMLGDRILRPSVVVVAKGAPAPEPEPEPDSAEEIEAEGQAAGEEHEDAVEDQE